MSGTESRSVRFGLEIRRTAKGRTLIGHAAVFNSLSEDLGGFREIIKPGAFDRALRENHDVRALVNHENSMILGRVKAGTLRLAVDSQGLRYEVDLPDTTAARDLAESIGRGDITGSSFSFRNAKDRRREISGTMVREISDLELIDVSPVTYPAYTATDAALRHASLFGYPKLRLRAHKELLALLA